MLRVNRSQSGTSIILTLEGKLVGPWVAELTRMLREPQSTSSIQLDLSAVSFVDTAGTQLLRDLIAGGTAIVACSNFVAELLAMEAQ